MSLEREEVNYAPFVHVAPAIHRYCHSVDIIIR